MLIWIGSCDTGNLNFPHHAGMQSDGMETELWTYGGQGVDLDFKLVSGSDLDCLGWLL